MALLTFLPEEAEQIRYNIPHLPVRLSSPALTGTRTDPAPHWHEELEILQVLKGSLQVRTRRQDISLRAGDICVITSRSPHLLNAVPDRQVRFFTTHVDLRLFVENYTLQLSLLYPLFFDTAADCRLLPAEDGSCGEIRQLLEKIRSFENSRPPAYALELSGLFHLLLAHLCRRFLAADDNAIPADEIVILEQMVNYISRFYPEKIRLTDIAAAGNVGRSKCCAIFKMNLNLSPVEFLNSYRLSVSRDLLITTPHKVSEIASACGFPHQSYFTKVFREKYGCTPNAYREQNIRDCPNF